jgi:NAD-dependent dihydropyrimidine dehydrogenase PreA subunit
MAYKITDECTTCGSCADSCPAEAIKPGDKKYTIDADLCIDCGSCVDTCPVGAIVEGD